MNFYDDEDNDDELPSLTVRCRVIKGQIEAATSGRDPCCVAVRLGSINKCIISLHVCR